MNTRYETQWKEQGLLEDWEKLFLKKQRLLQESVQLQMQYMKLFGELLVERYTLYVEAITKKKEIALWLRAYNRGEMPDAEKIANTLKAELADYYDSLDQLKERNQAAKSGRPVTEEERLKIRRIYRSLVKQLHPDLNPQLMDNEQIKELWNMLTVAYQLMDLETMEELEIQAAALLKGQKLEPGDVSEEILLEKTEKLQREIEQILNTDPYRYKDWIDDEVLCREKIDELKEEIEAMKAYCDHLEEQFEAMIQAREKTAWMN